MNTSLNSYVTAILINIKNLPNGQELHVVCTSAFANKAEVIVFAFSKHKLPWVATVKLSVLHFQVRNPTTWDESALNNYFAVNVVITS